MKRIYFFIILAVFGFQSMAENLNITGSVTDLNGNAVAGHEVFLTAVDSATGLSYTAAVFTNESGFFSDSVDLGNLTQGEVLASTESCNSFITISQFFNPGNYDIFFAFEICADTGGGGGDTIYDGCENYFSYYQNGLEVQFLGFVMQEGDITYNWSFGDGTAGNGMQTNHTYATEGTYTVSLTTVLNDTCTFTSYQPVYVMQDTSGGNDTIADCQNDFSWVIDGQVVALYGYCLVGEDADFWYWSFGDGTTGEGQNVTHEYNAEGYYEITLTTINPDSCVAVTTKLIQVGGEITEVYLFGTAVVGNSFLDSGTAHLYAVTNDTIGGGDIAEIAEASIDSAGMYFFNTIPDGNYLIMVQPDESSAYFETYLPTYYGNVIYWVDATLISLGQPANPYNINLQPAQGANSGEGTINGDVIGEGFKSQLTIENISLFLLDENGNPLEVTYSEMNSSFDFGSLAFGDYMVYAEVIGLTTEVAMVTLNAENPIADVAIYVSPNGVTTGVEDPSNNSSFTAGLYPNPVEATLNLNLNLMQAASADITIYNQMGQTIDQNTTNLNQGINNLEINAQSWPTGVYFVQVRTAENTINQKFIKK